MPDPDAVEVDTVGLRDQVKHLGGLLNQAAALVTRLSATKVPAQAFGLVGQPVHQASQQLQNHVGKAITGFAGAWQDLNAIAKDFSLFVEGNEKDGVDSLKAIQKDAKKSAWLDQGGKP